MATLPSFSHRLAGWTLLAGLVLSCWCAGPAAWADGPYTNAPATPATATSAPTSGATSVPGVIDRGAATPKALLESMAKVLGPQGDAKEWLGFQSPANRSLVQSQVEMNSQLQAKAKKVTDLVQAKVGANEANMVKSFQTGVHLGGDLTLRYQLSRIATDGKVDWDKVKITEDGDKAKATIADTGESIPLSKVDGKWYLGEETLAKDAAGTKDMTDKLMKVLDQLEQKVNAGQLTKRNFIQEYQKIVNDTMR